VIRAEHLIKEFTRPARAEGRFAGLRSFFSTRTVTTRAVDDVSLTVADGEIVGYLGPNGAGKSTTIKMLSGILVPTSGHVEVQGVVPYEDRRANALNIGAVFGQRTQLWTDLPLRESFDLVGRLYGMTPEDHRRSLDVFVDLLDMGSFMDTTVRSLSLGQRMRGDIVAAMLYGPPVLYHPRHRRRRTPGTPGGDHRPRADPVRRRTGHPPSQLRAVPRTRGDNVR
jgi:ABC-2 type transport system ATP-binding protein